MLTASSNWHVVVKGFRETLKSGDFINPYLNHNTILGIDDFVIPLLLSNPSELTGADKLQVFAWLNKGRSMDPNVIRLLLGETTGDMDLREMYLGIGDIFYF